MSYRSAAEREKQRAKNPTERYTTLHIIWKKEERKKKKTKNIMREIINTPNRLESADQTPRHSDISTF